MNLPNKLSMLRIILIPVFAVFFFLPFSFAPFVAVAVFIIAALTDFLDGYIARKYNLVTDLGKLLDPIADKVLVSTSLILLCTVDVFGNIISFGYVFISVATSIILARELLISAVRQIAAAKGVVIQANYFGKIKTVLQDITIVAMIVLKSRFYDVFSKQVAEIFSWVCLVLLSVTTLITILSGVKYMIDNRRVFAEK